MFKGYKLELNDYSFYYGKDDLSGLIVHGSLDNPLKDGVLLFQFELYLSLRSFEFEIGFLFFRLGVFYDG